MCVIQLFYNSGSANPPHGGVKIVTTVITDTALIRYIINGLGLSVSYAFIIISGPVALVKL